MTRTELRHTYVLLLLALAWPGAATAVRAAAPEVDFRESEVGVRGLTPGGRAVLWWLAKGTDGFTPWTSRLTEVLLDEDGDGAVTLSYEEGVPEDSLWTVVDLTSGEYALASPAAGPLREIEPVRGLVASLAGRGEIGDERRRLEVLVVRPGIDGEAGAWTAGAEDGSPADGDGRRDGRTQLRLERLEPLEETGPLPPRALRAGDVVIVGDALDLVFWGQRLPGDRSGEQGDATGKGGRR